MNGCRCRVNENRPRHRQLGEAKKGKLLHSLRLNILLAWDANDTYVDEEKKKVFLNLRTGYRFL